jgi:hypothetical protein
MPNKITTPESSDYRSVNQSVDLLPDKLFNACLDDDVDTIKNILDENPELIRHTYSSKHGLNGNILLGGNTLLHVAAVITSFKVVEELLARGIDVNLKNNSGFRPLEHAIYGKPSYYQFDELHQTTANTSSRVNKVLELLLKNGAKISEPQNREKQTALHLSIDSLRIIDGRNVIAKTNLDTVSMLLNYGADPNAVDIYGNTTLHILSCKYLGDKAGLQIEILDLLINKGADFSIENDSGKTPALCASDNYNGYVLWNLIKYGHPPSRSLVSNYHLLSKAIEWEIELVGKAHDTYGPLTTPLLHMIGSKKTTQALMKETLMKAFLYFCKIQDVSPKIVRNFLDITFIEEHDYKISHRSNDNFINTHKRTLENIVNKSIDDRNYTVFNFVNKIKNSSDKKNIHLNNEEDYEYAMSYADEEFGSELYESLAKEMKSCETTIDISTDEILTYIKEVLA